MWKCGALVVRMTYPIKSRRACIPATMYTPFGGQIGPNRITVHIELTVRVSACVTIILYVYIIMRTIIILN